MTTLLTHDWLPESGALDFHRAVAAPLRARALHLLRNDRGVLVLRLQTDDGQQALYPAQERVAQVASFFEQVLVPFVLGEDLRDWPALVQRFHRQHYKLVGLPFWACVASVEMLVLELLGRSAGLPVVELLGGTRSTRRFSIYLSSRDRKTTPEAEAAMLAQRMAQTGARAVKIGIGGRMSRNRDAWPGRSEALVAQVRRTLGDAVTIYADANGSYDAPAAIETGAMLQSHGVAMFEEPCPFDDLEMTRQVTHALPGLPVSGGENDHALPLWRWICTQRVVDVIQPDLLWAGGLLRGLQIARLAQAAGLPVVPHSPRLGAEQAPLLHFLSAIANPGPFHEYRAAPTAPQWECDHPLEPDASGTLTLPERPGFGCCVVAESLGPLVVLAGQSS